MGKTSKEVGPSKGKSNTAGGQIKEIGKCGAKIN